MTTGSIQLTPALLQTCGGTFFAVWHEEWESSHVEDIFERLGFYLDAKAARAEFERRQAKRGTDPDIVRENLALFALTLHPDAASLLPDRDTAIPDEWLHPVRSLRWSSPIAGHLTSEVVATGGAALDVLWGEMQSPPADPPANQPTPPEPPAASPQPHHKVSKSETFHIDYLDRREQTSSEAESTGRLKTKSLGDLKRQLAKRGVQFYSTRLVIFLADPPYGVDSKTGPAPVSELTQGDLDRLSSKDQWTSLNQLIFEPAPDGASDATEQ